MNGFEIVTQLGLQFRSILGIRIGLPGALGGDLVVDVNLLGGHRETLDAKDFHGEVVDNDREVERMGEVVRGGMVAGLGVERLEEHPHLVLAFLGRDRLGAVGPRLGLDDGTLGELESRNLGLDPLVAHDNFLQPVHVHVGGRRISGHAEIAGLDCVAAGQLNDVLKHGGLPLDLVGDVAPTRRRWAFALQVVDALGSLGLFDANGTEEKLFARVFGVNGLACGRDLVCLQT